MIEQQVLHVIYVSLQDCCPFFIQCMLPFGLILLMSLPQAEPDGSYNDRNKKMARAGSVAMDQAGRSLGLSDSL
jgi:hypothetical protein